MKKHELLLIEECIGENYEIGSLMLCFSSI